MKKTDGVFLGACREAALKYPSINYEEMIIDNCAMQLVKDPHRFDVMLAPNLYGSIISSIGSGLVGGPGVTPGANIGDDFLLFDQGCRNSGFDIAGQNKANPTALILSSVNMLRTMNLSYFADLISDAILNTYEQGYLTHDLQGSTSTS